MSSSFQLESTYYQRQVILPEIGAEGQRKLKAAKVVVVGAGGLGCPVLTYLARAGVGNIRIIDHDVLDATNLHRQTLFGVDSLGKFKSEAAASALKNANPHVYIESITEKLRCSNVCELLGDAELVIDGTDNFATKYLLNDACVHLGRTLISGFVSSFEGYLSVFNASLSNGSKGPTYRCIFPEPPPVNLVLSCAQTGVLGILPGVIGTLMAVEVIKLILDLGQVLIGKLLIYDALSASFSEITFERNDEAYRALVLREEVYYNGLIQGCSMGIKSIKATDLKARINQGEKIVLIDVREPSEKEESDIGGELIPSGTVLKNAHKIPRDCEVVVYCRGGTRSQNAIVQLQKEHGFTNLVNLEGGITAWLKAG